MDGEGQEHHHYLCLYVRLEWLQTLESMHDAVLGCGLEKSIHRSFGLLVWQVVPAGWQSFLLLRIPFCVGPLERSPRDPVGRLGCLKSIDVVLDLVESGLPLEKENALGRSAMLLAEGTRSIHVKDWSASSRSKKLCTKIKRDLEGLAPLIIAHLQASLSTNQMLRLLLQLGL